MQPRLTFAAIAIAALTLATAEPARAGYKSATTVYVHSSGAWGDLGAVRNSPDTLQSLYCRLTSLASGSNQVVCYAMDTAGNQAFCWTSAPNLVDTVRGLNGDSRLAFTYYPDNTCERIEVTVSSVAPPKLP